MQKDYAYFGAGFFYGVAAYQQCDGMSREQLMRIAEGCEKELNLNPVWQIRDKCFTLPGIEGQLTGLQVVAYFAVAVDLLSGKQLSDRNMSFTWLPLARKLYEAGKESPARAAVNA